ncbi:MAG TPA: RecQ family ATP-dependent DNA helicase [Acidimicrobiales bacterium]|nr:RecQ family ATP-dependent DNA helicase [Acidimicrobiales bacterium]
MSIREAAERLLARSTGRPGATFRPGQFEAIERLVEGRGRVLVVQRTGWGKSAVYFLATRLLRDRGAGPTVLVSPLLALMRNQVMMAERGGVRAATINSGNRDEWERTEADVRAGLVDLLLISPERLNNPRFRRDVLPDLVRSVGLLVVDEAHCISDWGHDFRPDYRRIAPVLAQLPPGVPVLCTTATANDRVVDDIVEQLGDDLEVVRGPLDRESLSLAALVVPEPAERLAWLATVVPRLDGSGIVYCLTVSDTERVADWLRSRGIDGVAYTGESDNDERVGIEEALLANEIKVVVATSALGMGFDKPDLAFVVHFQSPGSPIAYYQQVGRAGRAVDRAVGVLLRGREDVDIQDHFITTAFPPRETAEQIVGLLEGLTGAMPLSHLEYEVNAPRSRIESMLKVLEVDGAVERSGGGWQRTAQPWSYDAERVERVTALRRAEQAAMADYAATDGCRMHYLRGQLDDPAAEPCGRCDRCTGESWVIEPDRALVAAAVAHLRGRTLTIEPRRQWPTGFGDLRGRIPAEKRLGTGRALAVEGDGGWGRTVRDVIRLDGDWPDELLDAAAGLVSRWGPEPRPTWVAAVPSVSAPKRVDALARRLADALDVPYVDAVRRVQPGPPQRAMANSAQQLRNVIEAFAVDTPAVRPGAVLLVDDTVDSRWTLTTVGVALREAGSGPVHPVALAVAAGS